MIGLQECQDTAPRPQGASGQCIAALQKLVSLGPQNDLLFLLKADFIRGPPNGPNLAQVQRSLMMSNIGPRSAFKNAKTPLQDPKTPQDSEPASALQLFKNWSVFGPKMIYFSFWKLASSEAPKMDPTWPKFNAPSCCQALAHDRPSRMPRHSPKAPRRLRTVSEQVHCSSSKTGQSWAPK